MDINCGERIAFHGGAQAECFAFTGMQSGRNFGCLLYGGDRREAGSECSCS